MTLPIPSNVFTDGQLITEAGLYSNIWTPINTLYAQLLTLTQANGLQRGSFAGTIVTGSVTGSVTFGTAFGGTPNVTTGVLASVGILAVKMTSISTTGFNWTVFYTNAGSGSQSFTVHWMAIG